MKKSSIQLSKETKNLLKNLGKMGETYEDVILRLIKTYKNLQGGES